MTSWTAMLRFVFCFCFVFPNILSGARGLTRSTTEFHYSGDKAHYLQLTSPKLVHPHPELPVKHKKVVELRVSCPFKFE